MRSMFSKSTRRPNNVVATITLRKSHLGKRFIVVITCDTARRKGVGGACIVTQKRVVEFEHTIVSKIAHEEVRSWWRGGSGTRRLVP